MPKIKYIEKNFQSSSLVLIEQAENIITSYMGRGYELTLRQLYYQLVAKDIIPNTERSYNRLGRLIADAREAGLIDWLAIVDRTRNRKGLTLWEDPGQIIKAAYDSFRIDKWVNQPFRPMVWVEKEALAGVVSRACLAANVQVNYVSCRGYMSASTIWREANQLLRLSNLGQHPVIIHLGDHDPSGIDMTRDNLERLEKYSGLRGSQFVGSGESVVGQIEENAESDFSLLRLALNMDQVEQYDPPPNPAKITDSRWADYVTTYDTRSSWELDALDPDILVDLIQDTIWGLVDSGLWDDAKAQENEYLDVLAYVKDNWQELT